MQKILVPVFFVLPNDVNQLEPFLKIVGTTETVSTLLTIVGQTYNQTNAGKGGFSLGRPLLPSIPSSNGVSSPHIYAPAP